MPRYYFNTRIGDELISDPDGELLGDPDRAWEMARAMIQELLKTEGANGALLNATIEVTDDEGEIVLEFPFSEAILLDTPDGPITAEQKRYARIAVIETLNARVEEGIRRWGMRVPHIDELNVLPT